MRINCFFQMSRYTLESEAACSLSAILSCVALVSRQLRLNNAMNLLDAETVRFLSSSQVVTSVHSAVKELVENSLDAGAANIQVKLEDYGLSRIEVRDDGSGIKKEDALLVAAPHYTSKLRHFGDLAGLRTYGFRGEALASLAAVSNFTIITCTHEDPLSTVYQYDKSGRVTSERPSPLGRGTSVIITDLFRNLPVRKQQYKNSKKCRDEFKRVEDILLAFGLAHPGVRFVLKHNGNLVWQKVQGEGLKTSMSSVFGFSLMQQLLPFEYEHVPGVEACGGAEVSSDVDEGLGGGDSESVCPFKAVGYLPKATADASLVSRSSHDRLFLFINNRPVQCKPLMQMVRKSYQEGSTSPVAGRCPMGCLFLHLPPDQVDVNVEPNKTTVLLHHLDWVLGTLADVLQDFYKHQTEPLRPSDVGSGENQGVEVSRDRDCGSPEHSCVSVSDPETEGSGACGETPTGGAGGRDLNHPHGGALQWSTGRALSGSNGQPLQPVTLWTPRLATHSLHANQGQESATPSGQESATPSGQESATPSGQESATPSGQESATPSGQESATPSGQESAIPSGQESATPSGHESALPLGQESATPSRQSLYPSPLSVQATLPRSTERGPPLTSHVHSSAPSLSHSESGKGKKRNIESNAQPSSKRPKPGGVGGSSAVLQSFLQRKATSVDRRQEVLWESCSEVEGVVCNLRHMGERLQALERGVCSVSDSTEEVTQVIGQSSDPAPQLWLVLSNGNLSCIKMADTDADNVKSGHETLQALLMESWESQPEMVHVHKLTPVALSSDHE